MKYQGNRRSCRAWTMSARARPAWLTAGVKKPGQLAGFKGLQLQLLADQVQQGAGLFL
jgi:hypothetical protein